MKLQNVVHILAFSFLTLFIGSSFSQSMSFAKDRQVILVRKVGDEILKYLGDSTSTVLPINELGNDEYQIEFESEFTFVSDSVINIIESTIEKNSPNSEYLVKFLDCDSKDLIFGYAVGKTEDESVIACMGREQPMNCYLINITLPINNLKAELASESSFFHEPSKPECYRFTCGISYYCIFDF